MRQKDKHKRVFLCPLRHEKTTNKTYVRKSQYVKHGLGYYDLVNYKWQRRGQRNTTKRHFLKSLNIISGSHTAF